MTGPFLTTVTDTIYAQDGSLLTGTLTISNTATFTSADGFTILQGFSIPVSVTDGVFTVNLVPNQGSTPASTYLVTVQATQQQFPMTWSVSHSNTPVNLAAVIVS